ncbi:MAG: trypsin-like peptidase domain-containing protein [Pseudomonadota bacterium]
MRPSAVSALLAAALAVGAPPAAAVEFENSRFTRTGAHASAMVRAWQKGRSSAKASAFFVENRDRRLLVMTAKHVVGRHPVFQYRGRRATSARKLLSDRDVAIYEVSFGGAVRYASVGKFHLARAKPRVGLPVSVVGYPKGFSGALMASRNCELLPRNRLLHPAVFHCGDLDRWCAYAKAAGKSRKTCHEDAARRGRARVCARPFAERPKRYERHRQSTHAMNCAARLGNSGGPVLTGRRGVIGMPSAVFARIKGPYPRSRGVGVAAFSQSFKARARRLGIAMR